jgi:hypothetical protein
LWEPGQFIHESSKIRAFVAALSNAVLVSLIIDGVGMVFCLVVDLVTREIAQKRYKLTYFIA